MNGQIRECVCSSQKACVLQLQTLHIFYLASGLEAPKNHRTIHYFLLNKNEVEKHPTIINVKSDLVWLLHLVRFLPTWFGGIVAHYCSAFAPFISEDCLHCGQNVKPWLSVRTHISMSISISTNPNYFFIFHKVPRAMFSLPRTFVICSQKIEMNVFHEITGIHYIVRC